MCSLCCSVLNCSIHPSLSPVDVPQAPDASTVVMTTVVIVAVAVATAAPSITETGAGRGEDERNHHPFSIFQLQNGPMIHLSISFDSNMYSYY